MVYLKTLSLQRKDGVVLSRKSRITLDRPISSTCLDTGTIAFIKWLSSMTEDNKSAYYPIIVKYILKDKYTVFYGGDLLKDVTVVFRDCTPPVVKIVKQPFADMWDLQHV